MEGYFALVLMKTLLPHTTSDFCVEDERKAHLRASAWEKYKAPRSSLTKIPFTKEEWEILSRDPEYLCEQDRLVEELRAKVLAAAKKYSWPRRFSPSPRLSRIYFR